MKKIVVILFSLVWVPAILWGQDFDPAAGEEGSFAISKDNAKITGWATQYENYLPGAGVDEVWQKPQKGLGKAEGTSMDIVCLGRGGEITLVFESPVKNNKGFDFAVFENSFNDYFLELAKVFVSTDGTVFQGFETISNTRNMVSGYGSIDPKKIKNLAGKYRQGFGTGFDLEELKDSDPVKNGDLDLNNIRYIKIVDIPGDGSVFDSQGNKIYDPFPTHGSAGFDLDGVCSLSGVTFNDEGGNSGDIPQQTDDGAGFGSAGGCFISVLW